MGDFNSKRVLVEHHFIWFSSVKMILISKMIEVLDLTNHWSEIIDI